MVTLKDPNAKDKQTTLDDGASIYQKREVKSERQKFSEMKTFEEEKTYFFMYYFKPLVFGIIIAVFAISLLVSILRPRENTKLSVAFVDYIFITDITDRMQEAYLNASGLELADNEVVKFDGLSYKLSGDANFTNASVLATHIMAKEIDVFIAPEEVFRNYTNNGAMISMKDLLPADIYSELTDKLLFANVPKDENPNHVQTETTDTPVQAPYGLYIDDTVFGKLYFNDGTGSTPHALLGVIANSENKEQAIDYICYVFGIGKYAK